MWQGLGREAARQHGFGSSGHGAVHRQLWHLTQLRMRARTFHHGLVVGSLHDRQRQVAQAGLHAVVAEAAPQQALRAPHRVARVARRLQGAGVQFACVDGK